MCTYQYTAVPKTVYSPSDYVVAAPSISHFFFVQTVLAPGTDFARYHVFRINRYQMCIVRYHHVFRILIVMCIIRYHHVFRVSLFGLCVCVVLLP